MAAWLKKGLVNVDYVQSCHCPQPVARPINSILNFPTNQLNLQFPQPSTQSSLSRPIFSILDVLPLPPPPPPFNFRLPAQMELSGTGVKAKRISDDMVELIWKTGNEKGNIGFIVSRRAAKTEGWDEIASYLNFSPLNSKGWVSEWVSEQGAPRFLLVLIEGKPTLSYP